MLDVCLHSALVRGKRRHPELKFRTIVQLKSQIFSVAYHPKSTCFAILESDGAITVLDSRSLKPRLEIKATRELERGRQNLIFSTDGDFLVTGGRNGDVCLFPLSGARPIRLVGHTGAVLAVCTSADGRHIASGGLDETVRVWNLQTGKEIHCFRGHTFMLHTQFAAEGRKLISVSQDRTIRVWDLTGRKEATTIAKDLGSVISLTASPNGKWFLTGSRDNTIRTWDLASYRQKRSIEGHRNLSAIACTNEFAASAGDDGKVQIGTLNQARFLKLRP